MSQKIFRNEELIFKAVIKVAFLKDKKPTRIPGDILEIFKGL